MMTYLLNRILLFFIITLSFPCFSATITALGGNWSSATSWDLARIPICGDVIIIPVGVTINVSSHVNLNGGGCAPVTIQCNGNLTFSNGKKIRLGAGGCIHISSTGIISPSGSGGGSSELIEIDGIDWWKASDGTLLGSSVSGGVNLGCGIPLGINLSSFSSINSNQTVSLSWSVESSTEDTYFEIETSKDALSWNILDTITISESVDYQLTDTNPSLGLTYYCLNSVNVDGEKTRLGILVNERKPLDYLVYPNPANKEIFLAGIDIISVKILNGIGETMLVHQSHSLNLYHFNVSAIANGIYFMQIETKTGFRIERIVINND